MKLFRVEIRKVWKKPFFLALVVLICCANLMVLWFTSQSNLQVNPYRKLDLDLQGLSMQQKIDFLNAHYELVDALIWIDTANQLDLIEYENAGSTGSLSQFYYESRPYVFEKYLEIYETQNYVLYTDNLHDEQQFISEIKEEIELVAGYDDFLVALQAKAESLQRVSIFSNPESYEQRIIHASATEYNNMAGVKIEYSTQKGLVTAVTFPYSDIFLIFAMFVLSAILISEEKGTNIFSLIRSTPKGRFYTACSKIAVLATSLFIIVIFLYFINLFYCAGVWGLGNLSRSIQSVPSFVRSTLKTSVLQWLGLFFLSKWVGAFVCGLWVMLCVLVSKHVFVGYLSGALGLLFQAFLRLIVSATGKLSIIKYANFISILNSAEILGNYQPLYFFGYPVSLRSVEILTSIIFITTLSILFCIAYTRVQPGIADHIMYKLPAWIRYSKNGSTTIWQQESYKLFVMNRNTVILLLFILLQIWSIHTTVNYIGVEESYYKFFMTNISGAYTPEKEEWLINAANDLSAESAELRDESVIIKEKFFFQIVSKIRATAPNTFLIYETGYEVIFGLKNNQDRYEMLLAGIICSLCFSGVNALEYETGMRNLIVSTPLGRKKTGRTKATICLFIAGTIGVLSIMPRWVCAIRDYGIDMILARACDLEHYAHLPQSISLLLLMGIVVAARVIACSIMALTTLMVSQKIKNTFAAIFITTGMFCLPTILSLGGFSGFEWLSVYYLFHIAVVLSKIVFSILLIPLLLFTFAVLKTLYFKTVQIYNV